MDDVLEAALVGGISGKRTVKNGHAVKNGACAKPRKVEPRRKAANRPAVAAKAPHARRGKGLERSV